MVERLRIIEAYVIGGLKRYRVKVEGTNIVLNVSASDDVEALENAKKLLNKLKINFTS